jgi:hypothetical protein
MRLVMQQILENFPFLTHASYVEVDYLGIVGNSDNQLVSMYIYGDLPDDDMKKLFLNLGDEWWWETNRQLPINIALKQKWSIFRPYLKTFSAKDFVIKSGPCISLDDLSALRIKRRQIQLVKKLPEQ